MPSDIASIIRQRSSGTNAKNIWGSDGNGRVFTFGLLSYFFPRYKGHAERAPDRFIGRKPNKEYDKSIAINQWYDYNEPGLGTMADIVQNIESSRRILPYLGASLKADGSVDKYGIVVVNSATRHVDENSPADQVYINRQLIIYDAWRNPIHYQSRPPYDSYKLWSSGLDGKSGTDDDIVAGEG